MIWSSYVLNHAVFVLKPNQSHADLMHHDKTECKAFAFFPDAQWLCAAVTDVTSLDRRDEGHIWGRMLRNMSGKRKKETQSGGL